MKRFRDIEAEKLGLLQFNCCAYCLLLLGQGTAWRTIEFWGSIQTICEQMVIFEERSLIYVLEWEGDLRYFCYLVQKAGSNSWTRVITIGGPRVEVQKAIWEFVTVIKFYEGNLWRFDNGRIAQIGGRRRGKV